MGKIVAICQSNYIPWKGYFDLINRADLFIFHDDLQYTKNDWRNRNLIKTPGGIKWLTVPCGTSEDRLICEVHLSDSSWQKKHYDTIRSNYAHAEYFKKYQSFLEELYLERKWHNLSDMNQHIIAKISRQILGSPTEFEDSRKYHLTQRKAERVKELLLKCGATEYISGPAAKSYLPNDFLEDVGVELIWMDYSGYPEYPQPYPPFAHNVSIIDLLLNVGEQAPKYIKSFSKGS
jgi:hypothetical protein